MADMYTGQNLDSMREVIGRSTEIAVQRESLAEGLAKRLAASAEGKPS